MARRNHKLLKTVALIIFIVLGLAIFFSGYMLGLKNSEKAPVTEEKKEQPVSHEDAPEQEITEKQEISEIDRIMQDMTLSDMVYQMMFVTPESITNVGTVIRAGEATKKALQTFPVGGIVYFAQNMETRQQTADMIKTTQSFSKIPLFIAVDEEGGRVARLGQNSTMGTTKLPPMKEIGDTEDTGKAYNAGVTLAKDLKSLGFNVDFAPDADVLININNTEIGDRSFGSDPANVSAMVESIVKGMRDNGLAATLKHFPGHGSTYLNSHSGYSESVRTLEELRNSEFLPFKSGINAGAEFIMVSHMTLVNATEEKVPCSVSKEVITDMLIEELGYEGIIITDSFSMGAITEKYTAGEAAVKAIKAGADMVLMTPNLVAAHDAIVKAVESGEISQERIVASARKIIALKLEILK